MEGYGRHISVWNATAPKASFEPLRRDIDADVAIVGAGITGLTAALLLKREGKKVVVLERGEVASGTTGSTSAHLTSMYDMGYYAIEKKYGIEAVSTVARSMAEAIDTIERLRDELEIPCGFSRVPGYHYAEDDQGVEKIIREYDTCSRAGLPVEILDSAPLPYRTKQCFRVDRQALFHPIEYCNGLARAVHGDGCSIYTGTPVVALHDKGHPVVRTPTAKVHAKTVFLATHTPLGINPLQAALAVERSYTLAVRMPSYSIDGLFTSSATPYEYMRPYQSQDGSEMVIIGGKDHEVGRGDPHEALRALAAFARERFAFEEIAYHWSAQHYDPADDLPIIGPTPLHNPLFVATGMAGDGLVLGTLAGMMVTDAVMDRKNSYAEIYKPARINLGGLSEVVRLSVQNAKAFAKDRWPKVISPETLEAGSASVGWDKLSLRAIYRDEAGMLHDHSAVCPHMKCVVHWNTVEKSWDCPCHGSRYEADGCVIEGPTLTVLEER